MSNTDCISLSMLILQWVYEVLLSHTVELMPPDLTNEDLLKCFLSCQYYKHGRSFQMSSRFITVWSLDKPGHLRLWTAGTIFRSHLMIISKSFHFSQGSSGSPGITGLPGKAGQVVRVQAILEKQLSHWTLHKKHDKFNWLAWYFQGEKGSTGPPGPPGYPGKPVRIKQFSITSKAMIIMYVPLWSW